MIRHRRFFHPLILIIAVLVGALGLAAGGVPGLVLGLLIGYGIGFTVAVIIRHRDTERIDPFALNEPWRFFVRDALQARNRFRSTVEGLDEGPIADRLRGMRQQIDAGVEECWRIARRGQAIADARRTIKRDKVIRQIEEIESDGAADATTDRRLESLQSQLASSDHLGEVLEDAERRLKMLDTRLEHSVTRAIDVSARLGDDLEFSTVEEDMTLLVDELESLREALDDTEGPTLGTG
jgi:hypothetical protein